MSAEYDNIEIINVTQELLYHFINNNDTILATNEFNKSKITDGVTTMNSEASGTVTGVRISEVDDKCLNSLYIVFGIAGAIIFVLTVIIVMIKKINCIKKEDYLA